MIMFDLISGDNSDVHVKHTPFAYILSNGKTIKSVKPRKGLTDFLTIIIYA